ncbi:hypothetical protein P4V41_20800 [Fictibacillus nanhaiensis]|uniref:hypothetical protein n=1 Tax=Fictibacillus nanhaiensis TaxID=742169 RepID=UPI002E1A2F0D|nr:hypothetical protein [Fictibacillus nanhaiensis]
MTTDNNVKKYKKFLETIDKTNYLIAYKDKYYSVIGYFKFGITKGYLILNKDGSVCARQQSIQPFKMFMIFNSYMLSFTTVGLEEINKPTGAFQDTIKILHNSLTMNQRMKDKVTHVTFVLEKLDKGFNRLREIYEEVKRVFNIEVKAKSILDEEVVNRISDLMTEFTERQYEHLYLQIGLKETYAAILKIGHKDIKDYQEKKQIKEMQKLLRYLVEDEYQTNLKKSIIEFETNIHGKQTSFYTEHHEHWKEKLISNINEKMENNFKNDILTMLRN